MYMEKICNKCQENKDINQFNKKHDSKDGFRTICRDCQKLIRNKEKEKEQYKLWSEKNRKKLNAYAKEYRLKNPKPKKNKVKKTIEEKREYNRIYYREKRNNDLLYKLRKNIQRNICKNIRKINHGTNRTKTLTALGCSYDQLKLHLESQWEPWMNWDNYGLYNGQPNYGWDIDHIIPTSSAKTEEGVIALNHYTNLQPLCSYINRSVKQNIY